MQLCNCILVAYLTCDLYHGISCGLNTQVSSLVAQSVVLGYLADYFSIDEPTAEDTRNAYLHAMGKLQI